MKMDLDRYETLSFNATRDSGGARVDVVQPAEYAAGCHVSVSLRPSPSLHTRVPAERLVAAFGVVILDELLHNAQLTFPRNAGHLR